MGVRLPWWRLATLLLLIGALVLAMANGRTIEAVIIGVLLVPTLVVLGVWVYFWASPTQRRTALKYAQPLPEHDTYVALRSEIEDELQAQLPLAGVELSLEDIRGIAGALATEVLLEFDVRRKELSRDVSTPQSS